jgi:hypothetical protein
MSKKKLSVSLDRTLVVTVDLADRGESGSCVEQFWRGSSRFAHCAGRTIILDIIF